MTHTARIAAINATLATEADPSARAELAIEKLDNFGYGGRNV